MTTKETRSSRKNGKTFFRIWDNPDGTVDIWLTPGEATPKFCDTTGRFDYGIKVFMVQGIDPKDPQWGGDLAEHIRTHYGDWMASAEEREI